MFITIEAIYENGVFKPQQPVALSENQKVRITIHTQTSLLGQAYGIVGWKGDHETLERFALDPELDPQEGP